MEQMMSEVRKFIQDEEGASAVEYGVLVALIIAVCIAVIKGIGIKLNAAFTTVNSALP